MKGKVSPNFLFNKYNREYAEKLLAKEDFNRKTVSFYPSKLDCFIGKEKVRPQPGAFYGGWVTDMLSGPIKGSADSGGW